MRVTAQSLSNYQVEINAGEHQWISDEPADVGGDDSGPAPFDLLLGGLASCTIITLHMYARRKKWPLERVEIALELHAEDIVLENGSKERTSIIETQLTCFGDLTGDQLQRLQEIASRCPVHRTLKGAVQINTTVTNLEKS